MCLLGGDFVLEAEDRCERGVSPEGGRSCERGSGRSGLGLG